MHLSTRDISVVAIMTAACISTNYLMVGVVNVKLMDLIVFVSGLAFGSLMGMIVGIMTWIVYGTLNPYGFSLPILAATCVGESIYGLVGGILKRIGFHGEKGSNGRYWVIGAKFAIVGFLITFVYDLFTNIVSGMTVGIPIHVALLVGIPFSAVHELSNAAFFFVGVSPMISAIGRISSRGRLS